MEQHPAPPVGPQSQSGMATTSLVFGIVGILTAIFLVGFLFAIAAVILGAISITTISKAQGAIGGKGRAIGGLITGGATLFMLPVLAAIALPAYNSVNDRALQSKALSNLKQVGLACRIYAADNNGRAPDSLAQLEEELYLNPGTLDRFNAVYESRRADGPIEYLLEPGTDFDSLRPETPIVRQVWDERFTIVVRANFSGEVVRE